MAKQPVGIPVMATVTKNTAAFENVQWSYDYDNVTFRPLVFRCVNNSPIGSEGTIISQAPMRIDGHAYAVDDIIHTVPSNGFVYRCTTAGTSAIGQPSFGTIIGSAYIDGSVTWNCIGPDKATRVGLPNQTSVFNLPTQVADAFNLGVNSRGQILGIDQAYRMLG